MAGVTAAAEVGVDSDDMIFVAMDLVDAAAAEHGVDYETAAEALCARAPWKGMFTAEKLAKATRRYFCPGTAVIDRASSS